jgi:hypothetical protein
MKKYSLISIIYISVVTLLIFINSNAVTTYSIFGVNVTLPDSLWFALFLTIFYLISVIYFAISKFKTFLFEKKLKKEKNIILKNIENRILFKKEFQKSEILSEINEFVEFIEGLKIVPKKSDTFPYLEELKRVEEGEVVDLKKYKLEKDNPWLIKNRENEIKKATIKELLQKNLPITKEQIINNLETLSEKELKKAIENSNLKPRDYIEIAKLCYKKMGDNPELLFSIFEKRVEAYIYLLIQFEMIEKAIELSKENDIKFFEFYLKLRENGEKIDIEEYLDATIC